MDQPSRPIEHHAAAAPNPSAGLNWLLAANAREAHRRRLFRHAREEEEMLLMRRPIPTQKAYAIFGLLLGTLPPAAIFTRIFGGPGAANDYGLVLICLLMNIACALVGYGMGGALGRSVDNLERAPWGQMLGISMLMGLAWGAVTGAAGGMLFFIIGALFGIICAMPVGFIAFALFTPLHRTLARGGVIDARHFWPVASGIIMLIVALILSPHVFPY